ncbi:prolyl oligopeptidase family serine peptidase [soil metagenome]
MIRIAVLAATLSACSGAPSHTEPPPPPPVVLPSDPTPPAKPTEVGTPPNDRPPVAVIKVVKDTYQGTAVDDPYRWLEDDGAETTAWSAGQNTFSRAALDKLPDVATFKDELDKVLNAPITTFGDLKVAGGKLFARRKQPNKEQAELVVIADLEHAKTAKIVFDPTTKEHPLRSIDWVVPSPDGSLIAVAASDGGSEEADLHILDLAGKELEVLPNVQRPTAAGDVAWTPNGKGVYYTRYPQPGEAHISEPDYWQQVYFHQLATPVAKDRLELGDLPKTSEIKLEADARGRVIATVALGDGGQFRHYLHDKKPGWHPLDDFSDSIPGIQFGSGAELWVISRKDAPRGKLMRLAATATSASEATVVVPEGKDAMISSFNNDEGVVVVGDRVYVHYQLGGPSELRAFSLTGKPQKAPVGPPVSAVTKPVAWRGDVLVNYSSYVAPDVWSRYVTKTDKLVALPDLSPKPAVDFSNLEARRETATSKDGTAIPLNIIWPKGAPQDGSVPCLVTGYGGYAINEEPVEPLALAPLLTRSFCFVDVNLRGGGEFGEDWHRNGALLKKQNVFDDLTAALDYLVAKHYTSRSKLGIMGGSNGGLLMGAMITQHPDAMKAVVSSVGIYDMLRVETTPNGAFNITEFGSVTDPEQFKAMYAYSPYHHVGKGIRYPAILMETGANDGRVAPWHSRKMIAALQAANTGSAPIFLLTSTTSGHGIGTNLSERIEQLSHVLAFLTSQLR